MVKNFRNLLAVLTAFLMLLGLASSALAHAIDYNAYDIQPQASFDGKSGHFRLIDPIAPGGLISFRLTLELIESAGGGTTALPVAVTFGVKNSVPHDMMIRFGEGTAATISTLPVTISHTYEKVSGKIASLQTAVTAVAPSSPGSYFFKIQALDGFRGKGLEPGEGIVIHYKVAGEVALVETVLDVTLASSNIIFKAPSNTITATLKEKLTDNPVLGQAIAFYFEGEEVARVNTDSNGIATFNYDTSNLLVGDYAVAANFEGMETYLPSSNSTTQCVTYRFKGFKPPVLVQDPITLGLGVGLFQGKVIPVKIQIADYYDGPVTTAQPRLYWAKTNADVINTPTVAIQATTADNTNLMRYDPASDQYITNWNISTFQNGDYNIRVGLDEGSCATGHWVPVRIGKASK